MTEDQIRDVIAQWRARAQEERADHWCNTDDAKWWRFVHEQRGAVYEKVADELESRLTERPQPPLEDFKAHTEAVSRFLNDLYATMIDPCATGTITVGEMCRQLLAQAEKDREALRELHELKTSLAERPQPPTCTKCGHQHDGECDWPTWPTGEPNRTERPQPQEAQEPHDRH